MPQNTRTSSTPPILSEIEIRADDISNLQKTVSSLKSELESVKSSVQPITKRLSSVETQSRQNVNGIRNFKSKLASDMGIQKRLQSLEEYTRNYSEEFENLKKTLHVDTSNDKRIEEIGEIARQASNDIESVVKEITPEIGTNKRVNAMEAKLTFATNKFETGIDELKRVQAEMNDHLMSINDTISSHPLLKVMTSRMDAIESRIDRLMNTLSGLSQAPVIQRRAAGTRSSEEPESITFGTLERITSH